MKWLLVLLIFLCVIGYVIYRYRKHIQTALFMYQTFRRMKSQSAAQQKHVPTRDTSKDSELVRCPKCGKWSSTEAAVKLKSDFFCSLTCLEETMAAQRVD